MSAHPIGPLVFDALVKGADDRYALDPDKVPALRQALAESDAAVAAFYGVMGMLEGAVETRGAATELAKLLKPLPLAAAQRPTRSSGGGGGWSARR